MDRFRKLYFKLFSAMADAVELLEQGDLEQAKQCLIHAQQDAEEEYLDME